MFRRHQSQPVERVISLINPVLRGWVNYFAVGHSSECFSFIKDWAEKKVRRHLAHARKRQGFGWKRWNRRWLYDTLGLFDSYRVKRSRRKSSQQDRSHKPRREADGGAQCGKSASCVRRGGDRRRGTVEILRHSQTKERANRKLKLRPKPARLSSTLPLCPPALWSLAMCMIARSARGPSRPRAGCFSLTAALRFDCRL